MMSMTKLLTKWPGLISQTTPTPMSLLTVNSNRYYSRKTNFNYDIAVVGGGIVGAASARELAMRHRGLRVAIIEKENGFALHQSGNNSGVVHAGIYYKPGSLKAKLCVEGSRLAYEYFDQKGINYVKCGKLIVATKRSEVPRLLDLYERGLKNNVKNLRLLDHNEIRLLEQNCSGEQALWSPETGIVDWAVVTHHYINDLVSCNGTPFLNFEVKEFAESIDPEYPVLISNGKDKTIQAKYVLTCCGLHSDTVAMMTGCPEEPRIIPFRGEYLYIVSNYSGLVKTNIYPVPDPRFPFLGVHLTPTIDGRIIVGPNAVLALSKEGYKWTDTNVKELKQILVYPGFRKLALQYGGFGLKEMIRSAIMPLQVNQVKKYVSHITRHLCEKGPSGVRAQAMSKDGTLIEDFVFDTQPGSGTISSRVLHCRNAPSPGATSSLAIAQMIADTMKKTFTF